MSQPDAVLNTCGCCEGLEPVTPVPVDNAPGLSTLVYRVGTHGSFKESMLAGISSTPGIGALTSRQSDDPAIALLDAWAAVLDTLTFYQERVANEGFLRTAEERRSLLELAGSIGYQLNPGVAAGVLLAFTLEDAPGSGLKAAIAIGTKAQSVPAQNQLPQTFETVEALEAVRDWNSLKPRSTHLVLPLLGQKQIYLKGISTDLKKGDAILVVGKERAADQSSPIWDVRRVAAVEINPQVDWTVVTLNKGLGDPSPVRNPSAKSPVLYALRQRASLFGYNAPDWRAMADSTQLKYLGLPPLTPVPAGAVEWPDFTLAGLSDPPSRSEMGTGLEGQYFTDSNQTDLKLTRTDAAVDFNWGAGTPAPGIPGPQFTVSWKGWVDSKAGGVYQFFVQASGTYRLQVNHATVINLPTGPPNPAGQSGSIELRPGQRNLIQLDFSHIGGAAFMTLSWQAPARAKEVVPTASLFPRNLNSLHLDAFYPKVLAGTWAVLSNADDIGLYEVLEAVEASRSNFTISSKTTRLKLQGPLLREKFDDKLRETSVFVQSEALDFAERPVTTPVAGAFVDLDRVVDGLPPGRRMIVSGKIAANGPTLSEAVTLDTSATVDGVTRLHFTSNLQNTYLRDSVVISANVARATHGETKTEPLGSGNGSLRFQQFKLAQKPLTHVSAATPSGILSTLEVKVDGIRWEEVPTLYGVGPAERVYITSASDSGDVTVQFGDGKTGARLTTGSSNVEATYRVGSGLAGLLDEGQISLLMSRPLGLKGVVNPLAPSGATDAESRDEARRNAPLTVLTLDRIVSLQDYEDFTRAFAGIGKSKATAIWDGEHTIVHITIASADGKSVDENSDLFVNLRKAVDFSRDPAAQVRVASFDRLLFGLGMDVLVDEPTYVAADVLAAVKQALLAAYAFELREFAQPVTESEVVSIAQRVSGVIAVRLTSLYIGTTPSLSSLLPAKPVRWETVQGQPVMLPAQLLEIDPAQIDISEMKKV